MKKILIFFIHSYFFVLGVDPVCALSLELNVPADAYWVNSGLYLHKGETIHISASGMWNTYPNTERSPTGPEGNPSEKQSSCNLGELSGQIGLLAEEAWRDYAHLICFGREKMFTAHREGILYFIAADGDRSDNSGRVHVKIAQIQPTMISPEIFSKDIINLNIALLESKNIKTVELVGEHIILMLPVLWIRDLTTQNASALLNRLDDIYRWQADLAGTAPYKGQRIRIAFSDNLPEGVGGFAGNPIFSGHASPQELLDVLNKHSEDAPWLYAHELGHDFESIDPNYIGDFGDIWTNIFTTYALEMLGYDLKNRYKKEAPPERIEAYLKKGTYKDMDLFLGLAMLMGIKEQYGWDAFKNFFRYIKRHPAPPDMTTSQRWTWIRDAFLKSSQTGEATRWWPWIRNGFRRNTPIDLTGYFKMWHIPLEN
jgi:hypothetical protein